MKNITVLSDCPLCNEHTLQITQQDEKLLQCLYCGYASSDKFILNGKDKNRNEEYLKLQDDMKNWSKVKKDRIWIPSFLTLPTAMIYPADKNGRMKWSYAEIINIPEKEKSNYPTRDGKFYENRYDTENSKYFDEFYLCLFELTRDQKIM
jgi:Zn ribbon nucleic-acid-binding protein|tara:strand:+ start:1284 stop:1733 length:450 start_codon:yes stop_codon:yes gene_type:complete